MLLELLKPILDLELSITKANIKLELCKRLISNLATLGLEIDSILRNIQTAGSPTNGGVRDINSRVGGDSFRALLNEVPLKDSNHLQRSISR